MRSSAPLPLVFAAVLAAGCAEAPVLRAIPLTLQDTLPGMDTVVLADGLRFVSHDLEHPHEGALFAWARDAQGLRPLGALDEVTTLSLADPRALEELLVTHELTAAPTAPSSSLIFRGRPGEALALGGFGGPSRATLQLAQVTAQAEDRHLQLSAAALPFLGAGLHYALWVAHQGEAPVLLGKLGSTGRDEFEAPELVASFAEVRLTLELDAGDEAAPGAALMTGTTLNLGAALAEEKKTEVHDH